MIVSQAPPTLRKALRRDHGVVELDPSKISATLRDLAMRAHRVVQAIDGSRAEVRPGPTRRMS